MKYYEISQIQKTGIARAIYTTADHPDWKFGKKLALANANELGQQLGVSPDKMTMANQTHTSAVRIVDRLNGGELITRPPMFSDQEKAAHYESGFDGLVTNETGLMICTVEANCVPVYMLDPVKKAVAMVHSGWRGTVGKICANAIQVMIDSYGTIPSDLIVHIGPCICENCYEVGAEFIDEFSDAFGKDRAETFFVPREDTRENKYNLNMKKAIRHTLLEAGVLQENITDENRCTFETEELCSWRRQKPVKTSMLTAIVLL